MNKPKISRDFDPDIAKDVGTDAAIIYENIWFWINLNQSQGKNSHKGTYWTYNSQKGFQRLFFYLTPKQIRLCLEKLVTKGYLQTDNFNKSSYDRTLWYAIGPNGQIENTEWADQSDDSGRPIPDDNTDDNPDNGNNPIVKTKEDFRREIQNDPPSNSLAEYEANKAKRNKIPFLKGRVGFNRETAKRPIVYPKKGGVSYYGGEGRV